MNSPERIGRLLFRHTRKELSVKEKAELSDWRKLSERNELLFQTETNPEYIRKVISHIFESRDIAFQKFLKKYPQYQETKQKKQRARMYRLARIAAIFVVTLGASIYYIINKSDSVNYNADLVSPDGVVIALSDFQRGYLASKADIKLEDMKNGELLYIAKDHPNAEKNKVYKLKTGKMGQFCLNLPDGTLVWLNEKTTIEFPANFSQDSLKISLAGEAYFEVSEKSKSSIQITTGTTYIFPVAAHLDVKHIPDSSMVSTTLMKGKTMVQIESKEGISVSEVHLLPGQQAKSESGKLNIVQQVDTHKIIAWKK
jgi:ferric-dicitrate binding protein FerR (iron transport regulator)